MKFSAGAESEIKFAHIRVSEYFTAKQFHSAAAEFHLPARANLVEKLQANGLEFFMAPLVGLEPTTCGLTDHETKSQRAKQSIKNRDRSSVFGDHPATQARKPFFVKLVFPSVSVPSLPNFPGDSSPPGYEPGKSNQPTTKARNNRTLIPS